MASEAVRDRSRSPARGVGSPTRPPRPGALFNPKPYKYVDKTHLLARILADPDEESATNPYLFAPALRRVGKTTTVDMLAAMARGESEKFTGMAVMREDSPFKIGKKTFQVVRLSFDGLVSGDLDVKGVRGCVHRMLLAEAYKQHNIDVVGAEFPNEVMKVWLDKLSKQGGPVVVLIDEYDAPISAFLPKHTDLAEKVAQYVFKPFYEVLKKADVYKLFITGVANFAGTSLFSGFNNIINIMKEDVGFASLFGFTEQEIKDTYAEHIKTVFGAQQLDTVLRDLKEWYNGYRMHPQQADAHRVYNPWSVLNYFQHKNLKAYWVDTAMQTSLVEMIGLRGIGLLEGYAIDSSDLFANIAVKQYVEHWQQAAFHSGYATILQVTDGTLEMGPPNREVREWLQKSMAKYLTGTMEKDTLGAYVHALQKLEVKAAQGHLKEILGRRGATPLGNEADFTNFVVAPLLLARPLGIGVDVQVFSQRKQALAGEWPPNAKVPDLILWFHSGAIIVIELKFNKPAQEGVNQIKEKQYMQRAQDFIKRAAKEQRRSIPPRDKFHGLAVAGKIARGKAVVEILRAT